MVTRLGDECFACKHCRYNPTHCVLWCYLRHRDALRKCEDFEREPGIDD